MIAAIPDYKFLANATTKPDADNEINRIELSWIHRGNIDGTPILWTADGYRVHISWQVDDSLPEHIALPYSRSGFSKVPNVNVVVKASEGGSSIEVDCTLFRKHLLAVYRESSVYLMFRQGMAWMVTETEVRKVSDCFLAREDGAISLNPVYLLDAIRHISSASLTIKDRRSPVRVGVWGTRCAIIMPMTPFGDDFEPPIVREMRRFFNSSELEAER